MKFTFQENEAFVNTFDEAPIWSAAFENFLLKHLDLKSNISVADIGCRTGFPLLELAERLGTTSKLYGIDPWKNATTRAKLKVKIPTATTLK